MNYKQRAVIERQIVSKVVYDAVAGGYSLNVWDGEEMALTAPSEDAETVLRALFACDEETLCCYRDGRWAGSILFVYGNDGYDVISDYHVVLDDLLLGALALGETLETQALQPAPTNRSKFAVGSTIYFADRPGEARVVRDTVNSIVVSATEVIYLTANEYGVLEPDAYATPQEAFDAIDTL